MPRRKTGSIRARLALSPCVDSPRCACRSEQQLATRLSQSGLPPVLLAWSRGQDARAVRRTAKVASGDILRDSLRSSLAQLFGANGDSSGFACSRIGDGSRKSGCLAIRCFSQSPSSGNEWATLGEFHRRCLAGAVEQIGEEPFERAERSVHGYAAKYALGRRLQARPAGSSFLPKIASWTYASAPGQ